MLLYNYVANSPLANTDNMGMETEKKCCKCGERKMSDRQYCENGSIKQRTRKTATIYFGHCNGDLPDMARKDKTSLAIGMVTCYANSTLENSVDQDRQLQYERPRGEELMPTKNSSKAIDQEVAEMEKRAKSICREQGSQIWKIEIVVRATDEDGEKWLNKNTPDPIGKKQ